MRTHGTITRWNDDRGFGFVRPAGADADVFVHVSAFPRDGVRPRVDELISFEIEPGPDGRQRAVRVFRAGQKAMTRPAGASQRRVPARKRYAEAAIFAAIAGLGVYAWTGFRTNFTSPATSYSDSSPQRSEPASRYSCDGRTMCPEMRSCEEAKFFIRNCSGTKMDGDGDGIPCESQWCE